MAELAEKLLKFEEFADLNLDGAYELVNGHLEELVPAKPKHGWTTFQLSVDLGIYLRANEPDAYAGVELDIPTIPFHGRRPDFAYYSTPDARRIDLDGNRVLGLPTLVVEVVSEDDEARDTITKRREYALAGISHYWILDPQRRRAELLRLDGSRYVVESDLGVGDVLTSSLFPGLEITLSRLFGED